MRKHADEADHTFVVRQESTMAQFRSHAPIAVECMHHMNTRSRQAGRTEPMKEPVYGRAATQR